MKCPFKMVRFWGHVSFSGGVTPPPCTNLQSDSWVEKMQAALGWNSKNENLKKMPMLLWGEGWILKAQDSLIFVVSVLEMVGLGSLEGPALGNLIREKKWLRMDYENLGRLVGLALWQNCTLDPWHCTKLALLLLVFEEGCRDGGRNVSRKVGGQWMKVMNLEDLYFFPVGDRYTLVEEWWLIQYQQVNSRYQIARVWWRPLNPSIHVLNGFSAETAPGKYWKYNPFPFGKHHIFRGEAVSFGGGRWFVDI